MSGSSGDTELIVAEYRRVADAAQRSGVTLRAVGSVGIRLHLGDRGLLQSLGRPAPNDLDLAAPSAQRTECRRLFEDLGYEVDRELLMTGEGKRFGFEHGAGGVHVDLFIDRLEMCHTLELRERLDLYPDRLPLADLLLQKLQIVEINRKDVLDVIALLAEHDVGDEGAELVDAGYIAGVLADDWGFCHTVTTNLGRTRAVADDLEGDVALRGSVQDRVARLQAAIDDEPKSRRWKLRARVGTRKKWYQDVGEGTEAF